jgi:NADH-quinone oxidoreductase subunit K
MFVGQLILNVFLVFFGYISILNNKKNLLYILICLELILLSLNLNFVLFSIYLEDIYGQIFFLFVVTVAAAESAIGLAIAILFFRCKGTSDLNQLPIIVF